MYTTLGAALSIALSIGLALPLTQTTPIFMTNCQTSHTVLLPNVAHGARNMIHGSLLALLYSTVLTGQQRHATSHSECTADS